MRWAGELSEGEGGGGGRTVLVGVKFDSQSRELLTWALVKAAQPGDRVIALHVIDCVTGEWRTRKHTHTHALSVNFSGLCLIIVEMPNVWDLSYALF
jgi:hypothetical protein